MEHRCSPRSPIVLDVGVTSRGAGSAGGHTRDVGLGGMYVEAGPRRPPLNAPVRVTVRPVARREIPGFEVGGMVVHHAGSGFGLMFTEVQGRTRELLRALLRPSRRRRA
jgi:hypothetical protein